jgi:hypothetical protein
MKPEVVRVAKKHRPLKPETLLAALQKEFPDFEILPLDPKAGSFRVKQSSFAGARVGLVDHLIEIKGEVPGALARVLNFASVGTIAAATLPRLVPPLKRFLRERFAS